MMDFEQAKKVLQLTETRIKKFGSIDTSTSDEIHKAIFRFQPFQRLVIAHHAQEALTRLREQTVPLANSLEQLIATAINLNHAEFRNLPILVMCLGRRSLRHRRVYSEQPPATKRGGWPSTSPSCRSCCTWTNRADHSALSLSMPDNPPPADDDDIIRPPGATLPRTQHRRTFTRSLPTGWPRHATGPFCVEYVVPRGRKPAAEIFIP